ncbi:DUF4168 domain-containing protein [Leptothermofonsia sp. ETS-13]|uniref:DUF4168 domain-containing protein n=1 Tax=Leptothermofonsia sp. ETS-13 TaxID=3035696 RepID=UPI003B9F1845
MPVRFTLSRIGIVSVLSAASLMFGVTPHIAQRPVDLFSGSAAYAQGDPAITSYANAAYQIERLRQKKFREAKNELGGNVPTNVCQQPTIPASVRSICDEFMKESSDIIKSNGLSITQFNEITRRKDSDPALQQQIDNELLRIQKKTP